MQIGAVCNEVMWLLLGERHRGKLQVDVRKRYARAARQQGGECLSPAYRCSVLMWAVQSVMAVLEAFVYDPLINWRLLNTKTDFHGSPQEDGKFNTQVSLFLGSGAAVCQLPCACCQADNELDSEVIASSISSAAQGVSAVRHVSRVWFGRSGC